MLILFLVFHLFLDLLTSLSLVQKLLKAFLAILILIINLMACIPKTLNLIRYFLNFHLSLKYTLYDLIFLYSVVGTFTLARENWLTNFDYQFDSIILSCIYYIHYDSFIKKKTAKHLIKYFSEKIILFQLTLKLINEKFWKFYIKLIQFYF